MLACQDLLRQLQKCAGLSVGLLTQQQQQQQHFIHISITGFVKLIE